jgi:hypothetical protein
VRFEIKKELATISSGWKYALGYSVGKRSPAGTRPSRFLPKYPDRQWISDLAADTRDIGLFALQVNCQVLDLHDIGFCSNRSRVIIIRIAQVNAGLSNGVLGACFRAVVALSLMRVTNPDAKRFLQNFMNIFERCVFGARKYVFDRCCVRKN